MSSWRSFEVHGKVTIAYRYTAFCRNVHGNVPRDVIRVISISIYILITPVTDIIGENYDDKQKRKKQQQQRLYFSRCLALVRYKDKISK